MWKWKIKKRKKKVENEQKNKEKIFFQPFFKDEQYNIDPILTEAQEVMPLFQRMESILANNSLKLAFNSHNFKMVNKK
jgi:DNA helicase IV